MSATTQQKYKAVLFDLDGTIRTNQPEGLEAFIQFASQIGVPMTADQMAHLEREAHRYWADGALVGEHMTRYDERGFWANYYAHLLSVAGIQDCDERGKRIQHLFEAEHDPDDLIYADAWPLLTKLRADGYVVGLVSNRDKPVDEYITSIGLRSFFDFTLVGGQVNSWKPDRLIFDEALKKAGVAAHEAVYVGDNYYADILGAINAGMAAVLVDRRDVFEKDFDRRIHHLHELVKWL
ncbi:MAG TPA: HAD family hydrolase [Thermoflexales bacterium]|nr:HAD family hydrolase [Thermoflexales bacterium]HQW35463.1 HAD family hydrolase [Thermoflexales bacterium]HQZ21182.1 HAD family hydrolase [Thermoflexales bacterium]HRA00512.1 HAD family hydrolase [Thermoflexales bacterium]